MSRARRVLVLMHEDLVPPDDLAGIDAQEIERFKTERDVVVGLQRLGHEVRKLGVWDELRPLRLAIGEWRPDVVFNLLEEFHGEAVHDQHMVSYLELLRVAYTGCNPRGLVLARDKGLSKKILHYHRIRAPRFAVVPLGRRFRRPKQLDFPLIVKSLIEESSMGIARASVVTTEERLAERVRFIHERVQSDAIVEQFIDGRELYVGVMGNQRLTALPVWELSLDTLPPDTPRIATERIKHDTEFQDKHGITSGRARDLPDDLERALAATSKRIYRLLGLSGYARIDFRLDAAGVPYFLEANPNPQISSDEDFALAAGAAGLSFEATLQKIVSLGLARAGQRSA